MKNNLFYKLWQFPFILLIVSILLFSGAHLRKQTFAQTTNSCAGQCAGMCNAVSDPPGGAIVGHCSKHGCFDNGGSCVPNCNYACNPPYVDQNTVPAGTQYQFIGRFCCNGCDNCMNCVLIVTPTPTPTVTPTPTPTPTGSLNCDNLISNDNGPKLGDTITLTCLKTASYNGSVTYDYRLIHKPSKESANPNPLPTPFAAQVGGTTTYNLPSGGYGYYQFSCRVCSGGGLCTEWQIPGGVAAPTPTGIQCPGEVMCAGGFHACTGADGCPSCCPN